MVDAIDGKGSAEQTENRNRTKLADYKADIKKNLTEKKNIQAKLDKCGGKRAVIINIMLDHNMQITSSNNGRIIEIPYLYRLDRKEIGTEIIAKIHQEGYLQ